jgi:hypothetical protein
MQQTAVRFLSQKLFPRFKNALAYYIQRWRCSGKFANFFAKICRQKYF